MNSPAHQPDIILKTTKQINEMKVTEGTLCPWQCTKICLQQFTLKDSRCWHAKKGKAYNTNQGRNSLTFYGFEVVLHLCSIVKAYWGNSLEQSHHNMHLCFTCKDTSPNIQRQIRVTLYRIHSYLAAYAAIGNHLHFISREEPWILYVFSSYRYSKRL